MLIAAVIYVKLKWNYALKRDFRLSYRIYAPSGNKPMILNKITVIIENGDFNLRPNRAKFTRVHVWYIESAPLRLFSVSCML